MHKVILLGRPNVGKSTIFNRLIRSNRAITHDRAGITRDRMEGTVKSRFRPPFALVDTGGITLDSHAAVTEGPAGIRGFEKEILRQAQEALAESQLICLVVDGKDGLTPYDEHLASYIRRLSKPILLVVNKVDGMEKEDILLAEFHALGFEMVAVSAEHGNQIRYLEELIVKMLPDYIDDTENENSLEDTDNSDNSDNPDTINDTDENSENDTTENSDDSSNDKSYLVDFDENSKMLFLEDDDDDDDDDDGEEYEDDDDEIEYEYGEDIEIDFDYVFAKKAETNDNAENAENENTLEDDASSKKFDDRKPTGPLKICLLGRPNAGKSSILNAMLGKDRMIVSDVPGTTRDSVDVPLVYDGKKYVFVDTAGVRRRTKINDIVERFSVNSSIKSTTKADVTIFVIDALQGLTAQDKRLVELLDERKTPFLIALNKMDLVSPSTRRNFLKDLSEELSFCYHVPIIQTSAKNLYGLKDLLPTAELIIEECGTRIGTGQLNRAMEQVLLKHQAPVVKRVRPKFYYLTQAETYPPTFVFFVNDADRVRESYQRYLEKALRRIFAIKHAPMRLNLRSSHKKDKNKKSKSSEGPQIPMKEILPTAPVITAKNELVESPERKAGKAIAKHRKRTTAKASDRNPNCPHGKTARMRDQKKENLSRSVKKTLRKKNG